MGVIAVEPDQLFRLEHLDVDQPAVDWGEGEGLEAEHLLLRPLDFARNDQHEILDADAVFSGLVIAGLVGDDHARLERLVTAALRASNWRNTLRPFMDREEAADA